MQKSTQFEDTVCKESLKVTIKKIILRRFNQKFKNSRQIYSIIHIAKRFCVLLLKVIMLLILMTLV